MTGQCNSAANRLFAQNTGDNSSHYCPQAKGTAVGCALIISGLREIRLAMA